MTDAERDAQIRALLARQAEMEAEMERLSAFETYWLKPTGPGTRSRAERCEDVLRAVDAGGMIAKIIVVIAGAILTIVAAVNLFLPGGKP